MDLNASPLPEEDEEYFESNLEETVRHQEHIETSIQTLRREREERRERLRHDRPMRITRPSERDEGPQSKKVKKEKSRLPPGWLGCPKIANYDIGYIVASKVPLSESFYDCIPRAPGTRYSFSQVFHVLKVRGIKLGMVVDLTNTDRYYSTNELKKEGLKYLKIRCQGRDVVPDNESVNTFVFEVQQFIFNQSERQPKKYVLVHCTHGHNRSGYMIVHYLMRTQQASSVTEAIKRFYEARPPGIYKPDYIDALYDFYHEPKPDSIVYPPTPDWKKSDEIDLNQNGEAVLEDDDGVSYAVSNEKHEDVAVMTNDDVLGDKIPDGQEYCFRRVCYAMLKMSSGDWDNLRFPGSHPVSLDRENLQLLRQRYYYSTWKADGTRYMLLLSPDGSYLIDRNFKFRRVQMRFPCKNMNELHQYTLLDGEMIIDAVSPGKQERRYLIYDLIAINRVSIVELPFCERWKMIEKEVVEPRNLERRKMDSQKNSLYRYDLEPFRVRRKDFWLLSTVEKLLKEFIPKIPHEADGLIFQGWDDAYVPRTHEGLLKWKYPEMNSVDFLFEIGEHGSEQLFLHEKGKRKQLDRSRVILGDGADPASYSGKIIECSFDSEENAWVLMRVRADKSTPNEWRTYTKVMKSIKDNITEEVLLNEISEIIRLPMYADRIQTDSRGQKKGKPPMTGKK